MNIIKKLIFYQKNQNLIIRKNRDEIEKSNMKLALMMLLMGWISFIPFIVISFTIDAYRYLAVPYIVEFLVLTVFLLTFKKLHKHITSANSVYLVYFSLITYAIYTSAFVTPDYTSVIILFFLFQIPIITIDKGWRLNLIVIIYAIIYMIITIPFKDARLVGYEILNCLLFTSFGIGLGEALRYIRLENFELRRYGLMREKIDVLTGLNNRKSLFENLCKVKLEKEKQEDIGFLMIDVDYFKLYNDTYGHQAGDYCLKRIGDCFRNFEREFDISFYRYGGEEFVGIAKGYTSKGLIKICEKLNKDVFNMKIPHISYEKSFVTISIGFSIARDVCVNNYERILLSQADIAVYSAKAHGRNRTVQYSEGMTMENSR